MKQIDLGSLGLDNVKRVHWNLTTAELYEHAIRNGEARLAASGPLVVSTGQHTGRSPNDKFFVDEPSCHDKVDWGKVNKAIAPAQFDGLFSRIQGYLQNREVYVLDCYAGADPTHKLPIRVVTEDAWHNLFAKTMFIEGEANELASHEPAYTVINVPTFKANPAVDGTRSETFILVNFAKKLILIGGTSYAGEIKKSIFTLLNYLLPQKGVMSMHCSANVGPEGDVAIFFGLSGTGKTTLSADPERPLIGDDEHGWSDEGVFNFEGGCYAKVIKLSQDAEPEIWDASHSFGTVLENVVMDPDSRALDLDSDALTENTRAAYPITHLKNIVQEGRGGHPTNIIMLTADAFGVLPPIAKLTPEQAMYHFLSGYTAKVAGTEKGVKEPQATFSTCFGAPFMVLHPTVYAELLGERMKNHQVNCWLVNTGWTGGPYGVGSRMSIKHTRALIRCALSGKLENVPMIEDPLFGLQVPAECEGVPTEVLTPRNTWSDKAAFDAQAQKLAQLFIENFRQFEGKVSTEIAGAGPKANARV
ncbi:MAG: phosphoenolpyruvate carboxykinase [Candidatus Sericytochromatia bacterium]